MKFLPFWIFLLFFRTGAGLHFSLSSPFGERLFPLWIVGLLVGAMAAIQMILDVPFGFLLDKYGYRRFLKIGTVSFLIAAVCLMLGLTRWTYVLSYLFATVGWLCYGPGVGAYVLSHTPKAHAGRFMALRDVFASLGSMLSVAFLAFIFLLSPQNIGLVLFFLLFLALIGIFLSPKDKRSVHAEIKLPTQHHYVRRHNLWTLIKTFRKLNPASTMLLLLSLSGAMFYAIVWFVIPLIIAEQQTSTILGVGLGVFDLAIVVLGFSLGKLADKSNKRAMVFYGLLLFTISSLLIGFQFGWLFLILGFLATTGDEMAGISLWSWLYNLDKKHANDGAVAGVLYLSQDLGWMIGPIIAGFTYSILGATWMIVLGAIPILLTFILYLFIAPSKNCEDLPPGMIPHKPLQCRHKN